MEKYYTGLIISCPTRQIAAHAATVSITAEYPATAISCQHSDMTQDHRNGVRENSRTTFKRCAMEQPKQPKEKAREYLERRQVERRQNARAPLHDMEKIRQEIGWDLVERRGRDRRR